MQCCTVAKHLQGLGSDLPCITCTGNTVLRLGAYSTCRTFNCATYRKCLDYSPVRTGAGGPPLHYIHRQYGTIAPYVPYVLYRLPRYVQAMVYYIARYVQRRRSASPALHGHAIVYYGSVRTVRAVELTALRTGNAILELDTYSGGGDLPCSTCIGNTDVAHDVPCISSYYGSTGSLATALTDLGSYLPTDP
jgi:hypothetical protein